MATLATMSANANSKMLAIAPWGSARRSGRILDTMTVKPNLVSEHSAAAFWVVAPGHGEIRHETLPLPAGSEAVVETLYSGISRGTEALVYAGRVPPSEYGRMRAPFQAGEFPGPVKYGYCSVGRVTHGPPRLLGREVFCLHPHQTRYIVPAEALHPLPAGVPAARAVLAANLETAVNALWDAAARPGMRLSVVGAGSVGCLVAWAAARIAGCEVELVDINPRRAGIAAALGLAFALPSAARAAADVVVHASGTPDGLAVALALAAFEATVLELSWYGDRAVSVPLGAAFHSQRLTLKSSQVGAVAPSHRAEWTHRRRLEYALALLVEPALDALIDSEGAFEELPRTLAQLARSPGDVILHRVRYA